MTTSTQTILDTTRATLTKYITEFKTLQLESNDLSTQLNATQQQFINERSVGNKGEISSFPTIQDVTIYLFWMSYVLLSFMMAIHSSILTGVSQYVFLGGTVLAFIVSFFSGKGALALLALAVIYFTFQGVKPAAFFIGFLVLTSVIDMVIKKFI